MKTLFERALHRQNDQRPPVWFMRQAGRYHSHYQELKKTHAFIDLCKNPDLACETAMGPIEDFDFDAAILFSDLLFPLEIMGMGLEYRPGPKLGWALKTRADLDRLDGSMENVQKLQFQAQAIERTRRKLPEEKGLIGFVGGPATLFFYAVEGSHQGELLSAKQGLNPKDGRFSGFVEKLEPLLIENMVLQAQAGANCIAVLDTCAGEIDPGTYASVVIPSMKRIFEAYQSRCPDTPIVYYSKRTGASHWEKLIELPIQGLGIDWNHSLPDVLRTWGSRWAIQGNIDPQWLFLEPVELESRLRTVFEKVKALGPDHRRGWICGLGHGVLPKTPEKNVRLFLKIQREIFS